MKTTTAVTPAQTRITSLLDLGSFIEIGGDITARSTDFNLNIEETPSDGVITGYGLIDGNLVYVYSQDVSVLKGAVGEMHAKKITAMYDMAMKMGAPVIGLIDCAGLRLKEATDALNAFGDIYLKQTMASGVVLQITALFGMCAGGMAVIPALSDFTFMEKEKAKLFVNSPNAIAGNTVEKCDTSSAEFQSSNTMLVDDIGKEEEILDQIRTLISILPVNNKEIPSHHECMDDLNRICTDIKEYMEDTRKVLLVLSDEGKFFETKKHFAKEMVTGFISLNGMTVGAVANCSQMCKEDGSIEKYGTDLTAQGCEKAASFVSFCDAFNIPVLTLTNVTGFKATMCSEKNIASRTAKLVYAFASATVPKVTVVLEKAFGSAYIAMNSKSIGSDIVYAWENAEIGMMDETMAAKIMYSQSGADTIKEEAEKYKELQLSGISAAKRGYVDKMITPSDTRKYIIGAFEMLLTKKEARPSKKHGTV